MNKITLWISISIFSVSALLLAAFPVSALGNSHRDGLTYCSNASNIGTIYNNELVFSWDACLAWCDQNMTADKPLCFYSGAYRLGCRVKAPPAGGVQNCSWSEGPWPFGAWREALEPVVTPTPGPFKIANVLNGYVPYAMHNDFLSRPIGATDNFGMVDSNLKIGIVKVGSLSLTAQILVDLSAADLDWQQLQVETNEDDGVVRIGNAAGGGITALDGSKGTASIYLNRFSGIGTHKLSPDEPFEADAVEIGSVQIDSEHTVAVVSNNFNNEIYLSIWHDPAVLSAETMSSRVLVSAGRPALDYYNYKASVGKLENGTFLVVWESVQKSVTNVNLMGAIVDKQGNILQGDIVLDHAVAPCASYYDPQISPVRNGEVMVVYELYCGGNSRYGKGQMLDLNGNTVGAKFLITAPDTGGYYSFETDIMSDGRFIIVYYNRQDEHVYYRFWDQASRDFTGAAVMIDLPSENDYAQTYEDVAPNEDGGFAVIMGGYFWDGVDYLDTVYLQIFDAAENPLYSGNEMLISSQEIQYSWYMMHLEYDHGYYYGVWDYFNSNYNRTGVAFRKVSVSGEKGELLSLDAALGWGVITSPAIDIDRNGVPVIVWTKENSVDNIASKVYGLYNPIPEVSAQRVGICPDATSLGQVGPSCSNLVFTQIDGPDNIANTFDNIMANHDLKVADINSGGVFVDAPPAIAFKNFTAGRTVANSLQVSWFDLGERAGGSISFYYDTDNTGYNGTLLTSGVPAAESSNATTLNLTGIPNGTYYLYAKIDDGYYEPYYAYTRASFVKDADMVAPDKVVITNIGLISPVVVKDFVTYYFTSQSPVIKGTAEAGSTVHFTWGGHDYTAIAGPDGKFTLSITGLPRSTVDLVYYAADSTGNQSASRTLRLIIGTENFPDWLINTPTPTLTPTITPTPTATVTLTVTPSVTPTVTPAVIARVTLKVTDSNGAAVSGAAVVFAGRTDTTDSKGEVALTNVTVGVHEVRVNGQILSVNVTGPNATVRLPAATGASSQTDPLAYILIGGGALLIIIALVALLRRRKKD